jgi:hypothetical protein
MAMAQDLGEAVLLELQVFAIRPSMLEEEILPMRLSITFLMRLQERSCITKHSMLDG